MKMEFLASGAEACPLIRLYNFDRPQVQALVDVFRRLAASPVGTTVSLDRESFIEVIGTCHLELSVGERNKGICRPSGTYKFTCVLDPESWLWASELAEPFLEDSGQWQTFQWLTMEGETRLLLSNSGLW